MIKNKFLNLILGFLVFTNLSYADKLTDIQRSGVLKAGVKKNVGFDIDLIKYIASQLNVKLKLIPIVDTKANSIFKNDVDVLIASVTHKIKRDKNIDFSISYFFDGQSILAKSNSIATNLKYYNKKKVGALTNSLSGKIFKALVPNSEIIYLKNIVELKKALYNGKIECITSNYAFLSKIANKSNKKLKLIGKPFTIEPYGIGLKENESNLRDELNFAIQKAVKTGEYTKIYKKWFNTKPRRMPVLWP
jgi:polar amino acid transport system substrate-binding protein